MNEFQYDSTPQEQAMADLLKSQSHRLARQQIIFALIFLLIIVLAAYYIVTRMIWAIYDGTPQHISIIVFPTFVFLVYSSEIFCYLSEIFSYSSEIFCYLSE